MSEYLKGPIHLAHCIGELCVMYVAELLQNANDAMDWEDDGVL